MTRPFSLLGLLLLLAAAPAQGKKPDKKDAPHVIMTVPLGIQPGTTTKITVRGLKLAQATALRFSGAKVTAKILSKGLAPVPDKNPAKVGDTQLVAEVRLPAGKPAGPLTLVVATPTGESAPHRLLVETDIPVVAEKEPNEGFRQAQKIQIPQVIDGLIQQAKDVDVFRFEGKAGQKIVCEVLASRHGSGLDSILTLYDAKGSQVAVNDDWQQSADSRLAVTLPRTGTYYLSLLDAHDQGGPEHVYRLVVREEK